MQKTIQFWDERHDEGVIEWIYASSDELFHLILDHPVLQRSLSSTSVATSLHILEIGCGTSTLASDLCDFWSRTYPNQSLVIVSTDASEVCIQHQRVGNKYPNQCSYEVWNILEARQWKFDMILDKGCVDTLLFRAKKGKELAQIALSNIQHCLRNASSPYCVITSRKHYRKYFSTVFANITRQDLDASKKGDSNIVREETNEQVFLYVCTTG